jgi:CBS domain-containing protein
MPLFSEARSSDRDIGHDDSRRFPMQSIKVKELMVPLTDYPTVREEATLYDAVMSLEAARAGFDQSRARHRAILVLGKEGRVLGKIGFLDLLKSLEPAYGQIDELKHLGASFTPEFIRSLLEKYPLWRQSLDDICRKAARIKVKEIMYTPAPTELISEEATLDEAVHRLVVDRKQSLLVTREREVVGILRLSDVVDKVCSMIKACGYPPPAL